LCLVARSRTEREPAFAVERKPKLACLKVWGNPHIPWAQAPGLRSCGSRTKRRDPNKFALLFLAIRVQLLYAARQFVQDMGWAESIVGSVGEGDKTSRPWPCLQWFTAIFQTIYRVDTLLSFGDLGRAAGIANLKWRRRYVF
jgi:hypothetical protein